MPMFCVLIQLGRSATGAVSLHCLVIWRLNGRGVGPILPRFCRLALYGGAVAAAAVCRDSAAAWRRVRQTVTSCLDPRAAASTPTPPTPAAALQHRPSHAPSLLRHSPAGTLLVVFLEREKPRGGAWSGPQLDADVAARAPGLPGPRHGALASVLGGRHAPGHLLKRREKAGARLGAANETDTGLAASAPWLRTLAGSSATMDAITKEVRGLSRAGNIIKIVLLVSNALVLVRAGPPPPSTLP